MKTSCYVYQYLREDGTPYYIGKGSGNRAWVKGKHESIKKPTNKDHIIIIKDQLTEDEAHDLEKKLISKYGRKNNGTGILRNLTDGGEGQLGRTHTDEHKKRISQLLTGRKYGPRSVETRKKLSISHKGLKQSDETKKKRSEKLKGLRKSDETKKKMSDSKKGDKNPAYGKESPFKGKTHSAETKEKIKRNRANQVISDNTRKKMSESQKRRHSRNLNLNTQGE
jgi:hypothetical protein